MLTQKNRKGCREIFEQARMNKVLGAKRGFIVCVALYILPIIEEQVDLQAQDPEQRLFQ